ncbi:hypothetical protein BGAL_0012g00390 [Botrytis galanthina]|uniref:Uncharacterized protein n=1 Tax=Botrytis galanthina TaxID=278940 RepID=A0A4S8RK90_9HELO|nr:hypothetical protein BGAL_0012g00390 [Botrytis galanthina]
MDADFVNTTSHHIASHHITALRDIECKTHKQTNKPSSNKISSSSPSPGPGPGPGLHETWFAGCSHTCGVY